MISPGQSTVLFLGFLQHSKFDRVRLLSYAKFRRLKRGYRSGALSAATSSITTNRTMGFLGSDRARISLALFFLIGSFAIFTV